MSPPRPNGLQLKVSDATLEALDHAAALRGQKRASLAAAIIEHAVNGQRVDAASQEPRRPLPPAVAPEPPEGDGQDTRAAWLELDRGQPWREWAWAAGSRLRRRYPELTSPIDERWALDDFTRDGLLALAVWREQIDSGGERDPRMELAWLRALREFTGWLEGRQILAGRRGPDELIRPAEW